jgi:hypothetical protein
LRVAGQAMLPRPERGPEDARTLEAALYRAQEHGRRAEAELEEAADADWPLGAADAWPLVVPGKACRTGHRVPVWSPSTGSSFR